MCTTSLCTDRNVIMAHLKRREFLPTHKDKEQEVRTVRSLPTEGRFQRQVVRLSASP